MRYGYGINPSVSSLPLSNFVSQEMMSYSLPESSTITTSSPTPDVCRISTGTSGQSLDTGPLLEKLTRLYVSESRKRRCSHGFTLIHP